MPSGAGCIYCPTAFETKLCEASWRHSRKSATPRSHNAALYRKHKERCRGWTLSAAAPKLMPTKSCAQALARSIARIFLYAPKFPFCSSACRTLWAAMSPAKCSPSGKLAKAGRTGARIHVIDLLTRNIGRSPQDHRQALPGRRDRTHGHGRLAKAHGIARGRRPRGHLPGHHRRRCQGGPALSVQLPAFEAGSFMGTTGELHRV
jgi:hypothetical protein